MPDPDHGLSAEDRLDATASLRLPPDPRSASRARRFITDFCAAAQMPVEICQTAALLVSELVTNAIIHGRTAATIEIHRPDHGLRVSVHDNNPSLPAAGDQPALSSESGRGLAIVAMLATHWGIEQTSTGKAIWFHLALPA